MSDAEARELALTELDALLALADSGPLELASCLRMAELCTLAPGRARPVVVALSRQRDAAAVEALLTLPPTTPGVVEGVFAAMRRGVSRVDAERGRLPPMLALEFRSSTSRSFPALLSRASAAFGGELERIRVANKLHYRYVLRAHEPAARESAAHDLAARARHVELDLLAIHRDLARLRGVRVWLNGWCFDERSSVRAPARVALLRAWFDWAREQEPLSTTSAKRRPRELPN